MDDQMLSQFKDMSELTEYASAQYQTILELSRKLQTAEQEIRHLQDLLAGATPLLEADRENFVGGTVPNEKIIAEIQLGILKNKAMSGGPFGSELTLEETKKVSEYAKILSNLRLSDQGKKAPDVDLGKISNADLMKQLQALPTNG